MVFKYKSSKNEKRMENWMKDAAQLFKFWLKKLYWPKFLFLKEVFWFVDDMKTTKAFNPKMEPPNREEFKMPRYQSWFKSNSAQSQTSDIPTWCWANQMIVRVSIRNKSLAWSNPRQRFACIILRWKFLKEHQIFIAVSSLPLMRVTCFTLFRKTWRDTFIVQHWFF